VARPGRIEIHGPVSLVEAIALSGGFKDSARRTQVLLFRKVSADTNTALADPTLKTKLLETGYVAGGSTPEALGQRLKADIVRWSAVIKSLGIKLD